MSNSSFTGRLVSIEAPEFDLALTLNSGQAFHWSKSGEGFIGTIGNTPVYAELRGPMLLVTPGAESLAQHYFALDHSPSTIHASFPDDPAMRTSLEFCRGMRILRQPAWECLATFITSSMKQVAHIRQMSLAIREKFGRHVRFGDAELFTYPSPARLAKATEAELRDCKLGYRAKNLLRTARMIAEGAVNLERIKTMDDPAALAELRKLPGVGEKVANCVLLFAYERLRAFPIDVWIERVLRETYFVRKRNVTEKRLRDFSQTYFGDYGGYAQQYLFHHARMRKKETR
jgi:N-glycosylase/DNA lyase